MNGTQAAPRRRYLSILPKKFHDYAFEVDVEGSSHDNKLRRFIWQDRENAQHFVDALNRLVYAARNVDPAGEAAAFEDFRKRARAWRELVVKPDLPEEARQKKVLAENAVREKSFDEALDQYEAALATAPLWPEGQFNAALLSGELGDYRNAVQHMKYYLELLPDATDSPAARDKIIVWEHKLGVR